MNQVQCDIKIPIYKAKLAWMHGNQEKTFQFYDEAMNKDSKKVQFK